MKGLQENAKIAKKYKNVFTNLRKKLLCSKINPFLTYYFHFETFYIQSLQKFIFENLGSFEEDLYTSEIKNHK